MAEVKVEIPDGVPNFSQSALSETKETTYIHNNSQNAGKCKMKDNFQVSDTNTSFKLDGSKEVCDTVKTESSSKDLCMSHKREPKHPDIRQSSNQQNSPANDEHSGGTIQRLTRSILGSNFSTSSKRTNRHIENKRTRSDNVSNEDEQHQTVVHSNVKSSGNELSSDPQNSSPTRHKSRRLSSSVSECVVKTERHDVDGNVCTSGKQSSKLTVRKDEDDMYDESTDAEEEALVCTFQADVDEINASEHSSHSAGDHYQSSRVRNDSEDSTAQDNNATSNFDCEQCGATFTNSIHFVLHKRNHEVDKSDQEEYPFKCDQCSASYKQNCLLIKHMRKHTGEKPFKCDECGSAFAHYSTLFNHRKIHTGEKPFKCDECSAEFTYYNTLANHKRKHSGEKPYRCEECGVFFAHSSTLFNHRRIHTGEKPFKCEFCGAAFSHRNTLSNHKRIHTGEKPFKCDQCAASYAHKGTLDRHKMKHTGEILHKCTKCEASYSNSYGLANHMKKHIDLDDKSLTSSASSTENSIQDLPKKTGSENKPLPVPKPAVCATQRQAASSSNRNASTTPFDWNRLWNRVLKPTPNASDTENSME